MCLSPINIPRPNGSGATDRLTVPCSKCAACLQRNRKSWSFRLEQELKAAKNAYFVTLTYEDENLYYNDSGYPSVNKKHLQDFFKRLRKYTKFRYYAVAEYGGKTYRPHYHAIFFNLDLKDPQQTLIKTWKHGFVSLGTVTPASINYVTKYVITRQYVEKGLDPVFSLMSRRPGIGYNYIDKMAKWHEDDVSRFYSVRENGEKVALPRYYADKLYSSADREERAAKLDIEYMPLDFENYRRLNPNGNYYKYVVDYKNDYQRRLKQSLTKDEKL